MKYLNTCRSQANQLNGNSKKGLKFTYWQAGLHIVVERASGETQVIWFIINILMMAVRGGHQEGEEHKHDQSCHVVGGHLRELDGCELRRDGSILYQPTRNLIWTTYRT